MIIFLNLGRHFISLHFLHMENLMPASIATESNIIHAFACIWCDNGCFYKVIKPRLLHSTYTFWQCRLDHRPIHGRSSLQLCWVCWNPGGLDSQQQDIIFRYHTPPTGKHENGFSAPWTETETPHLWKMIPCFHCETARNHICVQAVADKLLNPLWRLCFIY